MLDKEKCLANSNPTLSEEWHPTKNGEMTPFSVYPNSNKKAWWLGKCGHEWEAVIATRNKGVGCPFCSNRKVLKGFNDLATTNPELAKEWHPIKNGSLKPEMVISGSDKKIWWLGECGHEWQQTIQNRKQGQGCPYCKKQIISRKIREVHFEKNVPLSESHPSIAEEWHPTLNNELTPLEVIAGSNKKVWWLGKCGHSWQASISNRTKGTGCPYCSNQKVLPGFNDFQTLFPALAEEWHPTKNEGILPSNVVAKSNKKIWWLGKCGHEWEQTIYHRTVRGQGCPICAKKLQTSFPEQAIFYYLKKLYPDTKNSYRGNFEKEMELDIFIPCLQIGIEYDGLTWHNSVHSREKDMQKYVACKSQGIFLIRIKEEDENVENENDFNDCDLAFRAVRHGSKKQIEDTIHQLVSYLGRTCDINIERDELDIRAQYFTGSSSRSFAEHFPELLKDWDYEKNGKLNPHSLSVSSGVYVWWKCHICGYEWKQRVAARSKGVGCEKCGYKKRNNSRIANRIKQKGSLYDNNPTLAEEWDAIKNMPLTPTDMLSGSGKKVWWKCKACGYEWEERITNRCKGSGCPICTRKMREGKTK